MSANVGFRRLTFVLWIVVSVGLVCSSFWLLGNPLALVHPDHIAGPPQLPSDVCERGWSDSHNAIQSLSMSLSARLPVLPPGAAERGRGKIVIEDDSGEFVVTFDGPVWKKLMRSRRGEPWRGPREGERPNPLADLIDTFDFDWLSELDLSSFAKCNAYWNEAAGEARASWEAELTRRIQMPEERGLWVFVGGALAVWTAAVWGLFFTVGWIARGFRVG